MKAEKKRITLERLELVGYRSWISKRQETQIAVSMNEGDMSVRNGLLCDSQKGLRFLQRRYGPSLTSVLLLR
jgi:hypothetical protein